MDVIKKAYIKIFNKNMPIYAVESKDLKDFTTTEKDFKKSKSNFPMPDKRIYTDDLLKQTSVDHVTAKMSEVSMDPQDVDYEKATDIRGKQLSSNSHSESDNSMTNDEEEPNPFVLDEADIQIR